MVAVVAGATRGAGRGIACMLGESGATVYCTGRSTRATPATEGYFAGRPETIEETAEMVTAGGGAGLFARVDHTQAEQVKALFHRIQKEQGGLDVLVNDISEGDSMMGTTFWKAPIDRGLAMLKHGIHSHIVTSHFAAPLMFGRATGLIVEIGDGDGFGYRGNLFHDLVKTSVILLAFAMAYELRKRNIAAIALTPGYMRTESVLDHFGVTEQKLARGSEERSELPRVRNAVLRRPGRGSAGSRSERDEEDRTHLHIWGFGRRVRLYRHRWLTTALGPAF
jgi:NAD(P)-dependent dehydrogenase (short-subunit alcohol dehydrogenase family)